MAKNKDGLEIGQSVDFETMTRINRERSMKKEVVEDARPKARKPKTSTAK